METFRSLSMELRYHPERAQGAVDAFDRIMLEAQQLPPTDPIRFGLLSPLRRMFFYPPPVRTWAMESYTNLVEIVDPATRQEARLGLQTLRRILLDTRLKPAVREQAARAYVLDEDSLVRKMIAYEGERLAADSIILGELNALLDDCHVVPPSDSVLMASAITCYGVIIAQVRYSSATLGALNVLEDNFRTLSGIMCEIEGIVGVRADCLLAYNYLLQQLLDLCPPMDRDRFIQEGIRSLRAIRTAQRRLMGWERFESDSLLEWLAGQLSPDHPERRTIALEKRVTEFTTPKKIVDFFTYELPTTQPQIEFSWIVCLQEETLDNFVPIYEVFPGARDHTNTPISSPRDDDMGTFGGIIVMLGHSHPSRDPRMTPSPYPSNSIIEKFRRIVSGEGPSHIPSTQDLKGLEQTALSGDLFEFVFGNFYNDSRPLEPKMATAKKLLMRNGKFYNCLFATIGQTVMEYDPEAPEGELPFRIYFTNYPHAIEKFPHILSQVRQGIHNTLEKLTGEKFNLRNLIDKSHIVFVPWSKCKEHPAFAHLNIEEEENAVPGVKA